MASAPPRPAPFTRCSVAAGLALGLVAANVATPFARRQQALFSLPCLGYYLWLQAVPLLRLRVLRDSFAPPRRSVASSSSPSPKGATPQHGREGEVEPRHHALSEPAWRRASAYGANGKRHLIEGAASRPQGQNAPCADDFAAASRAHRSSLRRFRQDCDPKPYLCTASGRMDAGIARNAQGARLRRNRPHADKAHNTSTNASTHP